ncbi:hypothetical protein PENTCL1PPCAC_14872, partial [Pristionchus entomophagus]
FFSFQIFLYTAASISVFANGLLLLLLFNKTSTQMGNYRLLLILFAVTDIFISIFHAWYIPMFILGDFGYIFFGYGTLLKNGPIASNSNMIYALIFFIPFCLLSLHFIYRYFSLARTTRGVPERFLSLIIDYTECKGIELNVLSIDYLDDNDRIDFHEVVLILGQSSVGGHTILISFFCTHRIAKCFKNSAMEIRTRRMHLNLFRALLIQFVTPVVFSLLPMTALFALPATGISLGQLGNVFGLLTSVFPALDPILIIHSVGRFDLKQYYFSKL